MTRTIFRVTIEAFDPDGEKRGVRSLVAWSCLEQSVPLDPSHVTDLTRTKVIQLTQTAMTDLMADVKLLYDDEIQENYRDIRETSG